MDFQGLVDGMAAMTCVVSVEALENGEHGAIRIVTGNRSYIDSIERPVKGTEMLSAKFVPNSEYTEYLTRDLNFEDFCYRSAVEKKCLHSYAHPERMDVWFNMTFLPLDADDGNLRYCTYTMEIGFEPSSERLSNVSGDLATRILEIAIKLRSNNRFAETMRSVVKDIRVLCDAEYSCILHVNDQLGTCSVISEDVAEESSLLPMAYYIDDQFYDLVKSWEDVIAGSNCLIVKSASDMDVVAQRNPRWHESLTQANVKTIALFPLKSRGRLLGYIWAVNFGPEKNDTIKETLELATYILASELDNHLLLEQLKILSAKDMLTGVMNRNEMNNYVAELSESERGAHAPVGVLFADLNGLKAINDLQGHAAGDKLLKDATCVLQEVFDTSQIFRAGGDEFTIIVSGISQDELYACASKVKEISTKYDNVSFAIGCAIVDDGVDVRKALRIADARMYEDKRVFYEQFPDMKRS